MASRGKGVSRTADIVHMGDTKIIFWDVCGTLLTAHGGDLDSLVKRKAELRLAFERTVRNFNLKAVPARLHDLFLRGVQAEREARMAEGIAHPEVRIDEIWFKLLEKFQAEEPPRSILPAKSRCSSSGKPTRNSF